MKTGIIIICAMLMGTLCFAQSISNPKTIALTNKLSSIIIPKVDIRDANIADAVQIITALAKEHDAKKTGVKIVLMDKKNKSKVIMSLQQVSLHDLLNYVAQASGLVVEVQDDVVVLTKPKEEKK